MARTKHYSRSFGQGEHRHSEHFTVTRKGLSCLRLTVGTERIFVRKFGKSDILAALGRDILHRPAVFRTKTQTKRLLPPYHKPCRPKKQLRFKLFLKYDRSAQNGYCRAAVKTLHIVNIPLCRRKTEFFHCTHSK